MTIAKLSVVPVTPTPEERWLTLSVLIDLNDKAGFDLKLERAGLKPAVMTKMRCWGMSDIQVTRALGGEC